MATIPESTRRRVYQMFNGRCAYCGCKVSYKLFEVDHFIAHSNGGKIRDNLVPACFDCNNFKKDLDIEEFRRKLTKKMLEIFNSHYGRMIKNYYGFDIPIEPIVFYFEQVENCQMDKVLDNYATRVAD